VSDDTIKWVAIGAGAYLLINSMSKGKLTQEVTGSIGNTIANVPVGIFKGAEQAGEDFGEWSYEKFISPIVSIILQPAVNFKKAGDPNVWFG